MKFRSLVFSPKLIWLIVGLLAVGTAWGLGDQWYPAAREWTTEKLASIRNRAEKSATSGLQDEEVHPPNGGHAGHDDSDFLELSDQARRNIGLTDEYVRPVELKTFMRSMTVPAMVAERSGRTKLKVVAPMTGIITDVYLIKGEAILPERLLFKIRLTHEDLVQAQTQFLKTLGELDVENQEIIRLEKLTQGVVAGKVVLERQYAKQKLQAVLNAHREALFLHGLSTEQIEQIISSRRLLSEVQVRAPVLQNGTGEVRLHGSTVRQVSVNALDAEERLEKTAIPPLIVQDLNVSKGEFVQAGDTLCVLADFGTLYIEGRAFEQDAEELVRTANEEWEITAIHENNDRDPEIIEGLKIVYIDNQVESESRAMHFYVGLPNQIVRDAKSSDGHRFLTWRYKPGQRMQLRVPVERWENRIVLPVDAVAQEGAEYFVFQQNGSHFDRRPVHVEYRDQFSVVIANDGSVFPGDIVAFTGAHQMQMAIKNKSGGAVDPHAGHTH